MAGDPVRVLLADDHTMFREGLARILESHEGVEVVGKAPNDERAAALVRQQKPDVVVMQVQVPLERAKQILNEMHSVTPPPKVVICTMFEDPRYLKELMRLGASAYVVKSASVEHLIGAIRAAVFDPRGENVVVGMPRMMLEVAAEGPAVLSERELELLLLAARGLPNRRIASRLHLSEGTVKRHLANVYGKIGVSSRGEAARKALEEGWITIRELTEGDERT